MTAAAPRTTIRTTPQIQELPFDEGDEAFWTVPVARPGLADGVGGPVGAAPTSVEGVAFGTADGVRVTAVEA